jgi:hypothetical protein
MHGVDMKRSLRILVSVVIAVFVAVYEYAHLDRIDTSFAEGAEANRWGIASRGWLPKELPLDARDVRLVTDIDTNEMWLKFRWMNAQGTDIEKWCGSDGGTPKLPRRAPGSWWPVADRESNSDLRFVSCGTDLGMAVSKSANLIYVWRNSSSKAELRREIPGNGA